MSKAQPMRISRRLDLLKASGRKHWTPAQFRRYMHKTLHAGAPYWPFPGEENPGGKNRPTPRRADAITARLARRREAEADATVGVILDRLQAERDADARAAMLERRRGA